jgi:hypothetical protein
VQPINISSLPTLDADICTAMLGISFEVARNPIGSLIKIGIEEKREA